MSGQLRALAALQPRKANGTHWIGGSVGPSAGVDDMEERKFFPLPEFEHQPFGRPARCIDCAILAPPNIM
jgi:hypothetical protein